MNFPKFLRTVFLLISFVLITSSFAMAQTGPFAPPAGQNGSTAIPATSPLITGWATGCVVTRGYTNISNPTTLASYGSDVNGTDPTDNVVVSLGDGGAATLTFATPISNQSGYDFAVFENGFSGGNGDFLELAFVEVSSDGLHFYRFNSVSLTQTASQVGPFDLLDATNINNLAGKYVAYYGTPFDLDELAGNPFLDINNVTYVRVIDVVGSIQDNFTTYDSLGNKVNDPWPTDFASCGFDLDAVAMLCGTTTNINSQSPDITTSLNVYPNPVQTDLNVEIKNGKAVLITLANTYGERLYSSNANLKNIDLSKLAPGLYIISVTTEDGHILRKKIIKN